MILPENNHFHNITLIGMAGAGKSTVGSLLAERLHLHFIDTDDLIADAHATTLQQMLDSLGQEGFRAIEEETLLGLNLRDYVIATGGSAVYSRQGMMHLKDISLIVWLDVDLPELEARVDNLDSRGLVNPEGGSFAELYRERVELYRNYTDLRIECTDKGVQGIVERIAEEVTPLWPG